MSSPRIAVPLTCVALALLAALALGLASAVADEVDDAAALPHGEALPRLEALLEDAAKTGDRTRGRRIHGRLADLHLARGDPAAALGHLEALVQASPQEPAVRVRYAAALLAVAKSHIDQSAMGRNVMPFLRDAADALQGLSGASSAGYEDGLRSRLALAVVEVHYLLRDFDAALAWLDAAGIDSFGAGTARSLYDLRARIHYAREAWVPAAEAFEKAGNPLGAAAAWDAARKPGRSVPIYAREIARAPQSADLIERALTSARYLKSQASLLAALEPVSVPGGAAGLALLLARAELLESVGRPEEALPLLHDAARRDESRAEALVRLGRVILLAAEDPENDEALDASALAYIEAIGRAPDSTGAADGISWIAARDFGRLWVDWRSQRVTARCLRVQEALTGAVPDDALAWANLGNTLRVLGRYEEALASYARARAANPYDPGVRSDQGLALSAAGRHADALAAYEASVELDPGHLAGRQNAARALWLAGSLDAAEAHIGAAVRTARAIGRSPGTYRFLADRIWRTRRGH